MISDRLLAEAVKRIAAQCQPQQVLLFGSRARGDQRADSDFDLAVVVQALENKWQLESDLYGILFDLPAAFDVLAFDADHWKRWTQVPVAFEHRILGQSQLVHDASR